MRRVYKYPMPIQDGFVIPMPEEAQILHVAEQRGQAMLWALVDPQAEVVMRPFRMVGTGHPAPETPHVATFQQGPFVWHLFEG